MQKGIPCEKDYIPGRVLEVAEQHGLETPYTRLVYRWHTIGAAQGGLSTTVTWTLHPTGQGVLFRMEQSGFRLDSRVIRHEPLGFHDYNCLQLNAFAVVSDSGTLPDHPLCKDANHDHAALDSFDPHRRL